MAEDTKEEKVPLHDSQAAFAALKRAQEKGGWPKAQEQTEKTQANNPTSTETTPIPLSDKMWPDKESRDVMKARVERQARKIGTFEETIPPEAKQELTETTKKLNTIAMEGSDVKSEVTEGQAQSPYGPPTPEQAEARQEGVDRFKTILRVQENPSEFTPPPAAAKPEEPPAPPVTIPSQEVAPAAAPWIKKEKPRMVQGTQAAAVAQVGAEPQGKPPLPTKEEVAAQQSIAQGQEIKKRWFDRIPFLRILGGKK